MFPTHRSDFSESTTSTYGEVFLAYIHLSKQCYPSTEIHLFSRERMICALFLTSKFTEMQWFHSVPCWPTLTKCLLLLLVRKQNYWRKILLTGVWACSAACVCDKWRKTKITVVEKQYQCVFNVLFSSSTTTCVLLSPQLFPGWSSLPSKVTW